MSDTGRSVARAVGAVLVKASVLIGTGFAFGLIIRDQYLGG